MHVCVCWGGGKLKKKKASTKGFNEMCTSILKSLKVLITFRKENEGGIHGTVGCSSAQVLFLVFLENYVVQLIELSQQLASHTVLCS